MAIVEWLARVEPKPDEGLIGAAINAAERVMAPDSELRYLWESTRDFDAWRANVGDLLSRLRA